MHPTKNAANQCAALSAAVERAHVHAETFGPKPEPVKAPKPKRIIG